jgi:DNA-binding transcriptional LysR family regulator
MDLYQLRYFLEAARELHFARAAEALHISPSALSQSVAQLERSVGRKLFTRSGRRVSLTAEGTALKGRAERIFDEVEAASRELSIGAAEELRIASREMITHYLLPPVLEALEKRRPGTRVALHELEPDAMAEALLKDKIDFGYYYAPLAEEGLESQRLGRLSSSVYAAPSLLRRLGRPKTAHETLGLPFVAPRPFGASPSLPSADGFPDDRLKRRILYKAELLETHRRLALQGLCAAVLPDGVAAGDEKAGRLVRVPGPPLGREIYFFKRKGRALPEAVKEINEGLQLELRRWTRA